MVIRPKGPLTEKAHLTERPFNFNLSVKWTFGELTFGQIANIFGQKAEKAFS
jgi:hypothetical protein